MNALPPALQELQHLIQQQLSYTISKNRRAWLAAYKMLQRYNDELAQATRPDILQCVVDAQGDYWGECTLADGRKVWVLCEPCPQAGDTAGAEV